MITRNEDWSTWIVQSVSSVYSEAILVEFAKKVSRGKPHIWDDYRDSCCVLIGNLALTFTVNICIQIQTSLELTCVFAAEWDERHVSLVGGVKD